MPRVSRGVIGHVLLYGVMGAVLTLALQLIEYRWLIIGHSFQIYGALVALLFVAIGIWAGRRLTHPTTEIIERRIETVVIHEVPVAVPAPVVFTRDETQVLALGLTPRELEILESIADGLSNREIAARLFVSENTVKTHSSRVFDKLGVQRRVQAVKRARTLGLIP